MKTPIFLRESILQEGIGDPLTGLGWAEKGLGREHWSMIGQSECSGNLRHLSIIAQVIIEMRAL